MSNYLNFADIEGVFMGVVDMEKKVHFISSFRKNEEVLCINSNMFLHLQ